jgi:cysteine synthase
MTVFSGAEALIGNTPLVALPRLSGELGIELFAKLEAQNPAGSVKDRVARAMLDDAEARGILAQGATIIEPTSGNTGIALAMLCAARGLSLLLTMPESMSAERVSLLRAYGARVVLTPGTLMKGAVEQAELLRETTPGAIMLRQFDNPANPRAHEQGTAEEIWRDTGGALDLFVAGIGTGGTITGVARALKPRLPRLRCIGVEPSNAAVLSGGPAGQHHLQGIGAGFVPKVLDRELVDEVFAVTEAEAINALRRLARSEGLLVGISSGAALAAVERLARRPDVGGKRCVVVLCDSGERYVSTALFRAVTG